MEKTNGKPIVIEFNGIPGSGKTTTMLEMKKILKARGIMEISPNQIKAYMWNYLTVMKSKDKRKMWFEFFKVFLSIRPLSLARFKILEDTFTYYLGVCELAERNNKARQQVCILDQGIIQGFVSMAYDGTVKDKELFLNCIKSVMGKLNNVICVNCITDVNVSKERMRARKNKWSRLDAVQDDEKLLKALSVQKKQFETIRKRAIFQSISIDMNDSAEQNAKKIIDSCMKMAY